MDYSTLEHKSIKDFEHYVIYENGDVFNRKTGNKIQADSIGKIGLKNGTTRKTYVLSRIIYETYYNVELNNKEFIKFKDNNENNYHYTNLIKTNKNNINKIFNMQTNSFEYDCKFEFDKNKEWKFVKNFEDYKISNYGDIFSLKTNKMLTPVKDPLECLSVKLIKNGEDENNRKFLSVHRILYDTFKNMEDPDNNYIIHIDKDPLNNFIDNLKEVTKSECAFNRVCKEKESDYKIYQYSLNNEFIKEWNNYNEIMEKMNYRSDYISYCCSGQYKSAYNFIWKHSKIIYDIDELSNFYPIITDDPDTKNIYNYKINKDGVIINKYNKILSVYDYNDYNTITLSNQNGTQKHFLVHRLVCLTLIKNENKHIYNMVNHLDENKKNNNVDNLEWCNNKINVTHSQGKKVNKINIETNEIIETFPSISDALISLKKTCNKYIKKCLDGQQETIYGYKWSYA